MFNKFSNSGLRWFEIENKIAPYVRLILIIYVVMLIVVMVKNTHYRKVYYPLSFATLFAIFFILAYICCFGDGQSEGWFLIFMLCPLLLTLSILRKIGSKLDNNEISVRKAIISLVFTMLIFVLILLRTIGVQNLLEIIGVPIREEKFEVENNIETNIYDEAQKSEEYNKHKEQIKKEFNNVLDKNLISIKDLKLNKDYNTIISIELLIKNDNIPNDELDFCKVLIKEYKKIQELLKTYNYASQTIHFIFTEKNPFAKETSTFYKEEGYISNVGTFYNIYLNPTPIKIDIK